MVYRVDTPQLPTGRTHLGYVDGIGEHDIEGSGVSDILQANPDHYGYLPGFGPTIKAGEFLLGYVNQLGHVRPMPQPDALGRNGTYVAFRKLHTRVAAFRQYLKANASSARTRKSCSPPRWSAAGAAEPRSCSRRAR